MKKLVVIMILSISGAHALELKREILRTVQQIPVKIAADTVRCSSLGYGRPELKIDVPALDWAATFNHRTFGEGQPCMTSVVCRGDVNTDIILREGEAEITADLEIVHSEVAYINEEQGTCDRVLVEDLKMELRGLTFTHNRTGSLGRTTAAQCLALFE